MYISFKSFIYFFKDDGVDQVVRYWKNRLNILNRGPKIRHHMNAANMIDSSIKLDAEKNEDVITHYIHSDYGFMPRESSNYDITNLTYQKRESSKPEGPRCINHGYALYVKHLPMRHSLYRGIIPYCIITFICLK